MGTQVTITVWTDDEARAVDAMGEAFRELDRVDALMTTWRDDSDVSRINAAAGDGRGVDVSPEVIRVVQKSLEIARLSGGAYCRFDPGAAHQLGELLRAVAIYAAGGLKALARTRSSGAVKLIEQLR